jgi:hypothetical protein
MTTRNYQAIAAILAGELATHRHNELASRVVVNIAYSMADYFARTNPRFDRAKFYRAVGVTR